jgi:hypothetical protein
MKNKYTIDVDKWRCGGSGANKLGEGLTMLRNPEGYCCCLGFITIQEGFNPIGAIGPSELGKVIPRLVEKALLNTRLANDAIQINDDFDTTMKEKVRALRSLFASHGVKLHFKNLKKHLK